jgi:predicted metalloenzyme YecM
MPNFNLALKNESFSKGHFPLTPWEHKSILEIVVPSSPNQPNYKTSNVVEESGFYSEEGLG